MDHPVVTVVQFCSTVHGMLAFSDTMLRANAGPLNYRYVLVMWRPTDLVQEYARSMKRRGCDLVYYEEDPSIGYVPNLRRMMSRGFDEAYKRTDYACVLNTDMAFGTDWLFNLVRRATPEIIPNSIHVTPVDTPWVEIYNFGIPEIGTFDLDGFWELHKRLFADKVTTEADYPSWEYCATFPYVMHRQWWEKCGPWAPEHVVGGPAPDRLFFHRVHAAGAQFVKCHDSICYHHEAVERRGKARPIGMENMEMGI
jgi:hypothetical protein